MSVNSSQDKVVVRLAFAPVGVLILKDQEEMKALPAGIARFSGTSYCEAVMKATFGEPSLVDPESIQVCRWAPPVLGLKRPDTDFEKQCEPRLPFPIAGFFLHRADHWPAGLKKPDVVIVRTDRDQFAKLLALMPPERIYRENAGLDRTAVPILLGEQVHLVKTRLVRLTNRALGQLNSFPLWRPLTVFAFKREWTSRALNFILDRTMANMSICRNSTVVPYLTGTANVSHFCTGGISWGRNPPSLLTAGLPYDLFTGIEQRLKS